MCIFKNWKKFGKPGKKFEKTSVNPVTILKPTYTNPVLYLHPVNETNSNQPKIKKEITNTNNRDLSLSNGM